VRRTTSRTRDLNPEIERDFFSKLHFAVRNVMGGGEPYGVKINISRSFEKM
jgi:hypothetical protein